MDEGREDESGKTGILICPLPDGSNASHAPLSALVCLRNGANHDVLEYLDLRKDPEPSIGSARSRMYSQSGCDCYCKTSSATGLRRGNQTDRSRVKLVTSKSSLSKTEVVKSAKKSPLTPARLVDDQPDSNRSATFLFDSPVLSPETSATLEDMQKLVNDATIRIKEINSLHRPIRFQNVLNTCSEEAPLDDEEDQLLYIRERVSYKFQEANGWIDTGYADSKSQERLAEGSVPKSKRITDFSAPKFKTCKEHRKEYLPYDSRGIRNPEYPKSADKASEHFVPKSRNLDEYRSPIRKDERRNKTETLSVRMGPSVNIERELVTQNLEDIHISPDSSFIFENSNVGTYLVSQDFRAKSFSPTRKEKVVKMVDKDDNVGSCRRLVSGKRRKKETVVKEFKANDLNTEQVSGFEKKLGNLEQKNSNLKDGKLEDKKATEMQKHSEDTEISGSDVQEFSKGSSLEESITLNTNQETGIVREETNDLPTNLASETKTEMRVRFSEEVLRRDEKDLKTLSETIQSENPEIPDPSFSKAENLEACIVKDLPAAEMPKTKGEKREKKIEESEKNKKKEHYKIIDQRFANILTGYCNREKSSEADGHFASSSVDSSQNSDNSEDLNNLYDPRINDLDNVLLAYDKIINDVTRSTRTIEKFLSRPEIEEYRAQNRVSMESSPSPPNKRKVEAKSRRKMNVSQQTQTKRNTESRTKNSTLKDRLHVTKKSINKESHSRKPVQTKMAKPPKTANKTSTIVKEKKKYTSSNNPDKFATRSDLQRKFGALKKQNKDSSEESSSCTAFSINTLSSSMETGLRNSEEIKMIEDKETLRSKPTAIQYSEISGQMDLEKDFDYATLYNMVHQDVLKQGFSEAKRAPAVVEHLIARVLREETLLIEDKIKSAFGANQIVPSLMKGLLENFQADAFNLKRIPQNDVVSVEVQTSETAIKNGNVNLVEVKKNDQQIAEEEIKKETSEPIKNLKNQSSTNEDDTLHLENEKTSKMNSNSELLKEISSEMNADESIENDCAYLMIKDSDTDSRSTKSTGVIRRLANEENGAAEAVENDVEQNANELTNLHVEDTVSKAIDKSSTIAKSSEVKPALREDSASSKENLLPLNEENLLEEQKEKLIESHSIQSQKKTSLQLEENVQQISSSDSLRDCASLRSSPKENSKASNFGNERLPETEIVNDIEGLADQRFRDSIVNKEKMLSDLYDDVHKKLFHSTLDSNRSNLINQNCRWSKSLSTIASNKTETQSDSSHSEGELCLLSSGSYSLGEVRVSKKNCSDGEATDACNDNVAIFVTKEMLTSWNESSKSLIQSIGQI